MLAWQCFALWGFLWQPEIYIVQNEFLSIRWYSLLFVMGFVLGRFIVVRSYRLENGYDHTVDLQMFYMVAGTLLGARMGHVFFYEPHLLQNNFWELFFFWKSGLASHGTAFGILLGMVFYSFQGKFERNRFRIRDRLRRGYDYFQVMDRLIIVVALGCALIRVGNFVNSEIIGKPTQKNYGILFTKPVEEHIKSQLPFVQEVVFKETGRYYETGKPKLKTHIIFEREAYKEERIRNSIKKRLGFLLPIKMGQYSHIMNPMGTKVEHVFSRTSDHFELQMETVGVYRHPTQLYESLTYLLIGILVYLIWNKHRIHLRPGSLLGFFLMTAFGGRFLLESLKENQVGFEANLDFNLGQILSIPLFIFGIYVFLRNLKGNLLFKTLRR
jgi:prolipoprotein diacylglyceryl transferase